MIFFLSSVCEFVIFPDVFPVNDAAAAAPAAAAVAVPAAAAAAAPVPAAAAVISSPAAAPLSPATSKKEKEGMHYSLCLIIYPLLSL